MAHFLILKIDLRRFIIVLSNSILGVLKTELKL
jgi:hypothetical protein